MPRSRRARCGASEAGLEAGYEVSLAAELGPEMRSGTSNCQVRIGSRAVDSPLVSRPNILLALNEPRATGLALKPSDSRVCDTEVEIRPLGEPPNRPLEATVEKTAPQGQYRVGTENGPEHT
jgi:Pyruvate/2-oxoacid:ferredoxin oxidoreductase gamma subunit